MIDIEIIKRLIEESNPEDWKKSSHCGIFFDIILELPHLNTVKLSIITGAGIDMATGVRSGTEYICLANNNKIDLDEGYIKLHYDRITKHLSDIEKDMVKNYTKKQEESFNMSAKKYLNYYDNGCMKPKHGILRQLFKRNI